MKCRLGITICLTFSLHSLVPMLLSSILVFDQKVGEGLSNYCSHAGKCFTSLFLHTTQSRLEELSHLWQELLDTSAEKRQKLQDAQKREHFLREADEVAAWISDREAVVSSEELGKDLEHVEMLQKNFADFLKVRFCHKSGVHSVYMNFTCRIFKPMRLALLMSTRLQRSC